MWGCCEYSGNGARLRVEGELIKKNEVASRLCRVGRQQERDMTLLITCFYTLAVGK